MTKIKTFETIDELIAELKLSTRIGNYLKSSYEDSEVMQAVVTGLRLATLQDKAPGKLTANNAIADLAVILRDAGYTYTPEDKREILLRATTRGRLSDYFRLSPEFATPYDALFVSGKLTFEGYYSLSSLTKAQIRSGMEAIESMLNETAFRILCLRYGIDENGAAIDSKTFEQIGIETGRTKSSAQQIFNKAEAILRHSGNLSKLAEFTISESELNYVRRILLAERNRLLELPDVQRYVHIANSIIQTRANACDQTPIEDLDISLRAYNCLKRGGYNTIGDVVSRAKELRQVRNLGLKEFDGVVAKLAELGYTLETD